MNKLETALLDAAMIAAFVFVLVVMSTPVSNMQKQAIEHGVAQHNPQTGEFEWL